MTLEPSLTSNLVFRRSDFCQCSFSEKLFAAQAISSEGSFYCSVKALQIDKTGSFLYTFHKDTET